MTDPQQPTIHVVAAFTTDADGRILLVRKAGSVNFMQPGGKPEAGESAREALVRELAEEITLDVDPYRLTPWGHFETVAANEPGHLLTADVFGLRLSPSEVAALRVAAEIEEAVWVTRDQARGLGDRLAPLARLMLDQPWTRSQFAPFRFEDPLVTDRLRLRPMTLDDVDAVHRYQSRDDVCEYLLFEARSRDQVAAKVEQYAAARLLANDGDYLQIVVERTDDAEVLGDIYVAIKSVDNLTAEIGWTLHPDHQGQGYAGEAAAAVIDLLFTRIGMHRVIAEYDPRNTASVALCERLGMRPEALFSQDLWWRGGWADTGIHALLDTDWVRRATGS